MSNFLGNRYHLELFGHSCWQPYRSLPSQDVVKCALVATAATAGHSRSHPKALGVVASLAGLVPQHGAPTIVFRAAHECASSPVLWWCRLVCLPKAGASRRDDVSTTQPHEAGDFSHLAPCLGSTSARFWDRRIGRWFLLSGIDIRLHRSRFPNLRRLIGAGTRSSMFAMTTTLSWITLTTSR